tara:strand:- start:7314 stop:8792 length:1479 start_codon:yes stop_codon:yes gene_type:complete
MFKHKEYNLTVQALFIFIGKLIQILFQFFVPIILIRYFSQSDYGIYQKVLFFAGIATPLLIFHFNESLYYFFPISKNSKQQNEFISQTYFQLLSASILVSLIILPLIPYLSVYINDSVLISYIYQILAILCLTASSSILENIFILEKKSKLVVLFASLDKFVRTFLLLSFVIFYQTIAAALLAIIIYCALRFLFLTFYLITNFELSIFLIKISNVKIQWKYVSPMGLGLFVGLLGKNADKLILAWLLTDADFALYSIGNLSLPFIATVYISVGNVIMPELAKYSKKNDLVKTLSLWRSMIIKNSILTIPLILFFLIQAKEIFVLLFTESYAESANVFRIILLALLIQMLGYGYVLRAYGKTKKILIAKIYRTLLSLIFGYIFIKNFGIIGAALTFLFSYFINAIIQLRDTKILLNVSLRDYLPWLDFIKLFAISIIPGIIIIYTKSFNWPIVYTLLLNSLIYFGIVILSLYVFNYFKKFGLDKILNKNIFFK